MKTWILGVLVASLAAIAQPPDSLWSRSYGGVEDDNCTALIPTADSGFALLGHTQNYGPGQRNYLLLKTNANGDSLWSRAFGGTTSNICWAGLGLADGGFLLAGSSSAFGAGLDDYWIVRTNSTGDSLWSMTYGGPEIEYCYTATRTSEDGFALAGGTRSFGEGVGVFNYWLVKTAANGDSLWSRSYGGPANDYCYSVLQRNDDGFVLAGSTASYGSGDIDAWLVRTNSVGDTVWTRTFGGANSDAAFDMAATSDGGYLVAGRTQSSGAGQFDGWLIKVSAEGEQLWSRTFGGPTNDVFFKITAAHDGGFLLGGWTNSTGAGLYDFWVVKVNAVGDSLWSMTLGGDDHDQCYGLAQLDNGNIAVAGSTVSFGAGIADLWLVMLSSPDDAAPVHAPLPASYELTVYPNPFNSDCFVTYALPAPDRISLGLYDVQGRLARVLFDGAALAGSHRARLQGGGLASGSYIVRLNSGQSIVSERAVLLK